MNKSIYTLSLLLIIASCNNKNPTKSVTEIFQSDRFDNDEFVQLATSWSAAHTNDSNLFSVAKLYAGHNHSPIWLTNDKGVANAQSFIKELQSLNDEGLNPADYYVDQLEKRITAFDKKSSWEAASVFALDTQISGAFVKAAQHLLWGKITPRMADTLWYHKNDSTVVLKVQADSGHVLQAYRSEIPLYTLLLQEVQRRNSLLKDSAFLQMKARNENDSLFDAFAIMQKETNSFLIEADTLDDATRKIKSYQRYHRLKETGKIDSATMKTLHLMPQAHDSTFQTLYANMERLRWLPQSLEATHIFVVIPKMELYIQDGGQIIADRKVIVGKPVRATPTLSQNLANIVFNPPWGVPPTIKKNDVIPGIARSGNAYLVRKGLKAYDRKGKLVTNASIINARNMNAFNFRQDPGPGNALGRVKFNMPNKWDIYLHDTPHREDFRKNYRALSSGCVRVQDPLNLANLILTQMDHQSKYTRTTIDSIVSARRTLQQNITVAIPVHIVYLTAFDADNTGKHVLLYKDIYKKDQKLIAHLQ